MSLRGETADLYQQFAKRFHESPVNLLWFLEFQLSVIRHPELRAEYLKQHHRLREEVSTLVVKMLKPDGVVDQEQACRYADLFIVLQTGLGLYRLLDSEGVPEEVFADSFELLMAGIRDKEKPSS